MKKKNLIIFGGAVGVIIILTVLTGFFIRFYSPDIDMSGNVAAVTTSPADQTPGIPNTGSEPPVLPATGTPSDEKVPVSDIENAATEDTAGQDHQQTTVSLTAAAQGPVVTLTGTILPSIIQIPGFPQGDGSRPSVQTAADITHASSSDVDTVAASTTSSTESENAASSTAATSSPNTEPAATTTATTTSTTDQTNNASTTTATSTAATEPTATTTTATTTAPTTGTEQATTTATTTENASANLITNASLETAGADGLPEGWNKGGYGTNARELSYPVPGHDGSAVKVEITNYTSGDAKWYFNDVTLATGTNRFYVFADDYMSDVPTTVTAQFTYADDSLHFEDIGTATTSASGWSHFATTFAVPDQAVSVTIFHLLDRVGTLTTDNYELRQAAAPQFPEGFVSLNFDDGWKSFHDIAFPALVRAGMKGTFYVVSSVFGFTNFMSVADIQDLNAGGEEIGAHSRSHGHLPTMTEAEQADEIIGSKQDLIDIGIPPKTFAYPYGEFNDTTLAITKANFEGARIADGSFNMTDADRYLIKSDVPLHTTPVADIESLIDKAVADKTWLVLVFHNITDDTSDPYSTSPADLQAVIDYLAAKNVPVKTITEGLEKLR